MPLNKASVPIALKRLLMLMPLIFLFVGGLILRFWNLSHGLPQVYYGDEGSSCSIALDMVGSHFKPPMAPHFFYYLYFFCDGLYVLYSLMVGHFRAPGDAWLLYKHDPTVFFIVGRSLSAVLGAATIPLIYLAGKSLFKKNVGFIAALFLAFSFIHVQWSQIAYRDAALIFLLMSAFFFCSRALQTHLTRYFILGGLFCGLATATKYQAVVSLIWGSIICGLIAFRNKQNPWKRILGRQSFLFFGSFVVGFSVGMPAWIFAFGDVKDRFLGAWSFTWGGTGFLGREGQWNWLYYLRGPLSYGLGLPVLIAALGGFIAMFRRKGVPVIFFLSYPLIYFLMIGFAHRQKSSYALPLVPFFCIAAAFFLNLVLTKVFREGKQKFKLVGLFVVAGCLILPSLTSTVRYLYLRSLPDTRNLAWNWLQANVPINQKVALSPYVDYQGAQFSRWVRIDRLKHTSDLRSLEEYRKAGIRYMVVSEWYLNIVLKETAVDPNDAPLAAQHSTFLRDLRQSSVEVAVFSPYKGEPLKYDRDDMSIASKSLWKRNNLGPMLWIYRLK